MKFRLTSKYGVLEEIRQGRAHTGIDLATPMNTELRAIADGIVEKVYNGGAIGKGVKIELEDGTHAIYGHMNDVTVKVGEKVSTGEFIGYSGNTGHSTGPHLHFALNKDGEWIDPTPIAEDIAAMQGADVDPLDVLTSGPINFIPSPFELFDGAKESLKETVKENTKEIIYGIASGLGEIVMETIYSFSLIGTAILIIMRVVGYKPAEKYIALLPTLFVSLRYLFN